MEQPVWAAELQQLERAVVLLSLVEPAKVQAVARVRARLVWLVRRGLLPLAGEVFQPQQPAAAAPGQVEL